MYMCNIRTQRNTNMFMFEYSKKKKCKKAKWLSEEALQITVNRRSKKQRKKGKIYPFEYRVPKNSKER